MTSERSRMVKMNMITIIVVMCLATSASAGSLGDGPDFEGLNNFLETKKADINTLKENLNSLSGPIEEAAKMAIDVADSSECNDEVISHLTGIKEAGLKPKGTKVLERLLSSHLYRIARQCADYLDQAIDVSVDPEFSNEVALKGQLSPYLFLIAAYSTNPRVSLMNDLNIHNAVWKMANNDSSFTIDEEKNKKGKLLPDVHKANMARAFEKYLDGRCPEFAARHKELFEPTYVVAYFVGPQKYLDQKSNSFKHKAVTYELCRAIQEDPSLKDAAINVEIKIPKKPGFFKKHILSGWPDLDDFLYSGGGGGGGGGSSFSPAPATAGILG